MVYQLVVKAKWACSLRFFLIKMSGFDRLLTKAASVMSQKMADLVLVSMAGKVFLEVLKCCNWLVLDHVS